MRPPKYGNDMQGQAERVQEARFGKLMSEQNSDVEGMIQETACDGLRVSLYELLRASQPAAAWAMGHMAGWPEMQHA